MLLFHVYKLKYKNILYTVRSLPLNLHEMTAIITGAGGGMGQTFAISLAKKGVSLAICDINSKQLLATEEKLTAENTKIISKVLDVSIEKDVIAFINDVESTMGSIEILINNAGIHPLNNTQSIPVSEWDRVLAVNLRSCFLFSREVLPNMKKKRFGRIINIASEAGKGGGTIAAPHYAASKGAILAFTRNLAREVGSFGITVNAIAPGRINTAMSQSVTQEENQIFIERSSVKRLGDALDIANAVSFLASPDSSFITGETLNVNGGTLMD